MKAKVSVVIPYFKSADTIDRAIKSVLDQTLAVCEIIIINDYSNTVVDSQKLKKMEEEILNLRVLNLEENRGPGYARNVGMDAAKGKYIAFLDSDDTWTKDKIEHQISIMENENIFLSAHLSTQLGKKERRKKSYSIVEPRINLLRNKLPTRSVMMVNNSDYRFDSNKRYAEDFLLWSQILLDGKKVILINKTMAHTYKEDYGEAGLTQNISKLHEGIIDVFNQLYQQHRIRLFEYWVLILIEKSKQFYRVFKVITKKR
ncbi:glycosyltransferase family 2 protein [Staphylococcus simiae]|uniref:glycosyltransferase family 2 protein n=1 Tax=Staphylococcus simiae TaxID=308354 RepID=UPI001A986CF3|nr:glycosyltransferase family 2 protein [Staphylococcus simiae]MBO1198292.1 glycosyltransferase family 2 protein [Staphylococcus simiae]MBO1201973.1 glycosyltransferase family 2 protein [Staphylococcus simiae]MBO1204195.1 glycosyltransferase family 2 protein [Staphylococcus simiae]MBO1210284.1 glycosyltransferase family 2 protein [Staphylococcus simiae]MBO1230429.1 glycosyltransferase family 2 protein [Staphylococcus simiae]